MLRAALAIAWEQIRQCVPLALLVPISFCVNGALSHSGPVWFQELLAPFADHEANRQDFSSLRDLVTVGLVLAVVGLGWLNRERQWTAQALFPARMFRLPVPTSVLTGAYLLTRSLCAGGVLYLLFVSREIGLASGDAAWPRAGELYPVCFVAYLLLQGVGFFAGLWGEWPARLSAVFVSMGLLVVAAWADSIQVHRLLDGLLGRIALLGLVMAGAGIWMRRKRQVPQATSLALTSFSRRYQYVSEIPALQGAMAAETWLQGRRLRLVFPALCAAYGAMHLFLQTAATLELYLIVVMAISAFTVVFIAWIDLRDRFRAQGRFFMTRPLPPPTFARARSRALLKSVLAGLGILLVFHVAHLLLIRHSEQSREAYLLPYSSYWFLKDGALNALYLAVRLSLETALLLLLAVWATLFGVHRRNVIAGLLLYALAFVVFRSPESEPYPFNDATWNRNFVLAIGTGLFFFAVIGPALELRIVSPANIAMRVTVWLATCLGLLISNGLWFWPRNFVPLALVLWIAMTGDLATAIAFHGRRTREWRLPRLIAPEASWPAGRTLLKGWMVIACPTLLLLLGLRYELNREYQLTKEKYDLVRAQARAAFPPVPKAAETSTLASELQWATLGAKSFEFSASIESPSRYDAPNSSNSIRIVDRRREYSHPVKSYRRGAGTSVSFDKDMTINLDSMAGDLPDSVDAFVAVHRRELDVLSYRLSAASSESEYAKRAAEKRAAEAERAKRQGRGDAPMGLRTRPDTPAEWRVSEPDSARPALLAVLGAARGEHDWTYAGLRGLLGALPSRYALSAGHRASFQQFDFRGWQYVAPVVEYVLSHASLEAEEYAALGKLLDSPRPMSDFLAAVESERIPFSDSSEPIEREYKYNPLGNDIQNGQVFGPWEASMMRYWSGLSGWETWNKSNVLGLAGFAVSSHLTCLRDRIGYALARSDRSPFQKNPVVSSFSEAHANLHLQDAYGSLFRTALALEEFRTRTGQYPKTLMQLVPLIMEELPIDWTNAPKSDSYDGYGGGPPTRSHVCGYLREGDDGYAVYIAGPDGMDDGGEECIREEGDIVLRIRRP